MKEKSARLLERKTMFKGYCFDAVIDEVIWPNRKKLKRDLIVHPGISVMVPLVDRDHVIMLRQYRYGAGKYLLELPAGTIDASESALACAKREIEEETGYVARRWRKLAACYASPGFNTEVINCFLASQLVKTKTNREADEMIELEVLSTAAIRKLMSTGRIEDAKTLVALFYFFNSQTKKAFP